VLEAMAGTRIAGTRLSWPDVPPSHGAMVSSTPTSQPDGQAPPTTNLSGRDPTWRQLVVVTLLSAVLVILVSVGSAGFQGLKSDISNLKSDMVASETRQREDMKDLRADIAVLKTDNADIKTDVVNLKGDVAVLKTDVAVLKADNADIKGEIRALNGKMDRLLEGFLAARS